MVQLREDASLHNHRSPLDRGFENCEWNWQSCGCEGVGFDCFPESSNPLHWGEMLPIRWDSEYSGFAAPQIDWYWQALFYCDLWSCWEFGSVHQGLSISGLHSYWRKQLLWLFFSWNGKWIRNWHLIIRSSFPLLLCDRWRDWWFWQLFLLFFLSFHWYECVKDVMDRFPLSEDCFLWWIGLRSHIPCGDR